MSEKKSKVLEFLNSKLVIIVLVFGLLFMTTIFAGDMTFENGDVIVDGYFTLRDVFAVNVFSFDHNTGDISMANDLDVGGITSLVDVFVSGDLSVDGAIISNTTKISAYKSSGQSISDTTWTKITFDTEDFDTLGEFSDSRFTATQDGYYEIYSQLYGQELGSLHRGYLSTRINGVEIARARYISPGADSSHWTLSTFKILHLDAGDYIEIYFYHENGNTRNINCGEANTYININRLS